MGYWWCWWCWCCWWWCCWWWWWCSWNEGKNRHPFAQTDDTGNLTKHWPCAVKTHFPGQHIRPGRIYTYVYILIYGLYGHIYIYVLMFLGEGVCKIMDNVRFCHLESIILSNSLNRSCGWLACCTCFFPANYGCFYTNKMLWLCARDSQTSKQIQYISVTFFAYRYTYTVYCYYCCYICIYDYLMHCSRIMHHETGPIWPSRPGALALSVQSHLMQRRGPF